MAKKLKVLALFDVGVPMPPDCDLKEELKTEDWKTEANILGALRELGHTAEYLVRATRTGKFIRPAASAEAMYEPGVFGHGAIDTVTVTR